MLNLYKYIEESLEDEEFIDREDFNNKVHSVIEELVDEAYNVERVVERCSAAEIEKDLGFAIPE